MAFVACPGCGKFVSDRGPGCRCQLSKPPQPPKPSESPLPGLAMIVALLLVGYCALAPARPPSEDELKRSAYIQSKDYVTQRLKSPGTADFPLFDRSVIAAGDRFTVHSYVDSQNRFGAKLRAHYRCSLRYHGGDRYDPRNWSLLELVID